MTSPDNNDSPELTPETVLEWLKAHPDFVTRHPEACEYLTPPKNKENGKGVADFQHYMVQKLRADRQAVMDTTREVIEISRANMQNLSRIHDAVLKVLECHTIEQFAQVLTDDICAILDLDLAAFVFETSRVVNPYVNLPGIRLVPEGTIASWLGTKPALLQSNIFGVEEIYGGGARLVRSQAVVRLDTASDLPPSVIAFGSRDPEMFTEGQGIEMVGFLTRVIEKSIERILFVD